MTDEHTRRFGWLPWRRQGQPPASAPAASGRQPRGWLGGWRKPRHDLRESAAAPDAILDLARQWLLAQGGQLRAADGEIVAGTLADGTPVRYTRSAARARREPDSALLALGTPAFDALLADVTRRGTALFLQVPAAGLSAEDRARQVFASPAPACHACATADPDVTHHATAPDCPIRAGRFVVLGTAKGASDAVVERQWDALTIEHTFRVAITSSRGRHAEIVRLGVDARSGQARPPFELAALRRASAAAESADSDITALIHQARPWAEAQLEPAALAAARLERLRALPEYQRRQEHITSTYARLLVETPDLAHDLLAARERELTRLADAYAIELETQLVNVAVIASPMAHVRLGFAGGGAAALDVDLARGTVAEPRCPTCESSWRIGARCAEGHITCLACQQACAHCGARRCARCAAAPMEACTACGAMTCASCARATARGRHRLRQAPAAAEVAARSEPDHAGEPAASTRAPDSPELAVGDLDVMTQATWQAAVFWLLEGLGYAVERTLATDETSLAVVCRPTEVAAPDLDSTQPEPRAAVLALAHRAARGDTATSDPLERVYSLAAQARADRALILTTAPLAARIEHQPRGTRIEIVDRAGLARLLAMRAAAYPRARASAESEADARARAAARVRETLIAGAGAAGAILSDAVAGDGGRGEAESATKIDKEPVSARMERVTAQALVVRRALAALDTLLAEWEADFAPVPTREGALAITVGVVALESQRERAQHLTDALRQACAALAANRPRPDRTMSGWFESTLDELRLYCRSLADRCTALDPTAWRSFHAVRDEEAVRASAEALAASKRSGMRARRLRDEIAAQASAAGS